MLVARLLLVLTAALGLAAVLLFFLTGNRGYLRILSRAFLGILILLALLGIGVLTGRLLGVAL